MTKPIFHLQPETNWVNDPNGPSFIGGKFHMFYQHNPFGPVWGNMTWGHAVSPDMARWRRLPHALHPDMPYDKDGVFSGCCVVKDGAPHIIYTGTYPETVCMAVGDGDGTHFTKFSGNPILTNGGRKLRGWRDPYIWPEAGGYRMLIGSGDDGGAFVEIYEGDDLYNWRCAGRLAEAKVLGLDDTMWECPVMMFGDDGPAVLLVSAIPSFRVKRIAGVYRDGAFTGLTWDEADLGDCIYAPNLVKHPDGRWIMFSWLREGGAEADRVAQGWQGMLSVPRELRVENGCLFVNPATELKTLRGGRLAEFSPGTQAAAVETGLHFEIEADIFLGGDGKAIFDLLCDGDGYSARIELSREGVRLIRSQLSGVPGEIVGGSPLPLENHIRIFVDGTAIEIFINGRETLTTRVYTATACLFNFTATGECRANKLEVYSLMSCYLND